MKNGSVKLSVESAMMPIKRNPQPPTGVIISIDEALLVSPPSPRKVMAKIVGNMIASKK